MLVIRKALKVSSEDCYKEIVGTYLDYVCKNMGFLTESEISELLRYSVCVCLDLHAVLNLPDGGKLADQIVGELQPIFDKYHLPEQSRKSRMAMLEACVHCIEFSRRRLKEHHG